MRQRQTKTTRWERLLNRSQSKCQFMRCENPVLIHERTGLSIHVFDRISARPSMYLFYVGLVRPTVSISIHTCMCCTIHSFIISSVCSRIIRVILRVSYVKQLGSSILKVSSSMWIVTVLFPLQSSCPLNSKHE